MSTNYQLSSRYPNGKNARVEEEPQATQRVIIPRGMVNPNQTTVINVPAGMENMPTIIAKKSHNSNRASSPSRRQYVQNAVQEQPLQYSKAEQEQYYKALQEKANSKRLKKPTAQDQKYSYEAEPKYYVKNYPAETGRKDELGYYGVNYPDQDIRERSSAYENDQRKSRTLKRYLQIPEEYRNKMKMNRQSRSPAAASPNMEVNKSLRIKRVLDRLDEIELQGLEEDLKNFQTARRKLIFDVSSMKMF